ncbi:hypothetical protein PENSPDRAFT_653359 [Peniophora sp. CONT]|nr:hypothetical protein PENSPDRAFT_653359 [Peniophora sp. CONT]
MHASFVSIVLAALAVGPAIAAPFPPVGQDGHVILPRNANINKDGPHFILPRNANINKDGPHFILPRQGGRQSSQPLQPATGGSLAPSIGLPLDFQPIGPAVPASKRETARPVSFIPVGAALDGTNSAPVSTASMVGVATDAAAAPASSSTAAPVGTRPVSFIPVGAALGNNVKREPVMSPPFIPVGSVGGAALPTATEAAPATTESATTGVRPVSFIPVNALEGETASKRASTIHTVSFIPEGALDGNAKRIVDPVNTFPVDSPIDYAGAQKREPIRGPVSFIPVSALNGAQRQARRQEAATVPPAGSAPGTVPASVSYPAGESSGPMVYMFQDDGSVIAMPVPSSTV